MKPISGYRLILTISIMICLCTFRGEAQTNTHNSKAKALLSNLQGNFTWEILKPSTRKISRTGHKQSVFKLDSLMLLTEEQFTDSNIEHIALLGWDEKGAQFFSVGAYNIDMGPHIMYGKPDPDFKRVVFLSKDGNRVILNVTNRNEYFWTYQNQEAGQWVFRDMKITFRRMGH